MPKPKGLADRPDPVASGMRGRAKEGMSSKGTVKIKAEKKQFNIRMDADLQKQLRIRALEEDRDVTEIVVELIKGYLAS